MATVVLVDGVTGAVVEVVIGVVVGLLVGLVDGLVVGVFVVGGGTVVGEVVVEVDGIPVVAGASELVVGTASSPSEHDTSGHAAADSATINPAARRRELDDLDRITVVMSSSCAEPAAAPTDRGPDPVS